MGKTKVFHGITPEVWECVKKTSHVEHGTVYDPPNGDKGTATTKTIVGDVVLNFSLDPAASTVTYTIVKKPFLASQNQIWNGTQETIDGCRS
ncbi:MAG: hypothetical protein P1U56_19535 [Saprospiraceae bacterium]|nr:hypothetical protein [Saprospiraceae bacterium]